MGDSGRSVTVDRILGGRVTLRQPAKGYRAAIDPVLLAAAVSGPAENVLDLGCGVGTAAICLARRLPDCRVTGLEIQAELAALAAGNAADNDLADRIEIVTGDLLDPPAAVTDAAFDAVMANPPYHSADHPPSTDRSKAAANQEGAAGLEDWIRLAARVLKHKGWLTIIVPADRVDALCAALHPGFGDVRLAPLWPKTGRPAKRVIARARLGVRTRAMVLPGLVLHRPDDRFTAEADAVLRDAAALPL